MDENDVGATVAGLGDLEVSRRLARVPHPYLERDARDFLAILAEGRASGEIDHFVIDLASGPRAIGAIGVHDGGSCADARVAEVGYWIARPHWGRGYAREAVAAMVRRTFFDRDFPPDGLVAQVHCENPASCRVLEACGFVATGSVHCTSLATGRREPGVRYELRRQDVVSA